MDINRVAARAIGLVLIALVVGGCTIPPLLPAPTVTVAAPPATAAPTACGGPWTWAYGRVTPEFVDQVQEALAAAGLTGTVEASTFGETDGCGAYHAMSVDYVFAVQVESLDASDELEGVGAQILEIARRFVEAGPAPNLGHLVLTFEADGQRCRWSYDAGAWSASTSPGSTWVTCPVPISP
jgi:hypothetical protein